MFKRAKGSPRTRYVVNATSVAYSNQALVYSSSNTAIPADATSGEHLGITMDSIDSDDDRYTTAGTIMIDELGPNDVFEGTVTGTFTAASVGAYMDLSNSLVVNADGTSKNVVYCVGYISATKGLFKISAGVANRYVATT